MAGFNRYLSGQQIVTEVMKGLGLTAPTSISDSTDPTAMQMWQLATDCGRQLLNRHDWEFLQKDFVITTNGSATYTIPPDLNNFQDDASWNRTTRLPVFGALREYEWQALKARNLAGTTFVMLYRMVGDQLEFYETPTTPQEVHIPYTSCGWVQVGGPTSGTFSDTLGSNSDVIMYEPEMFKAFLKFKWLDAKGLDANRAEDTFNTLLSNAKSNDAPRRMISLGKNNGFPYLSVLNMPDSGYGS